MPTIPVLAEALHSNVDIDNIPDNPFGNGSPIYANVRNAIDRLSTAVINALYETIGAAKPDLKQSASQIKTAFEDSFKTAVIDFVDAMTSITFTQGSHAASAPVTDALAITFGQNQSHEMSFLTTRYAYEMAGAGISNRSFTDGVLKDLTFLSATGGTANVTIDPNNPNLVIGRTHPATIGNATAIKFNIPGIKIVDGVMYVTKTNVS